MQVTRIANSTFLVILVATIGVLPAYAQTSNGFAFAQPDFVFRIQTIVEDFRLGIAGIVSSGAERAELIKEFALDKQQRIDEATARGEAVSIAVEERRQQLVEKLDEIPTDVEVRCEGGVILNCDENPVLSRINEIKSDLDTLGELNEIRTLYTQFPDCVENCSQQEKDEFNAKVNSLETWNEKCSGTFDIDNYAVTNDSFNKLSQLCPDLTKFSKNHLMRAVSGNT